MAESEKNSKLKQQVALLPLSPGVYQFVDRSGTIIYVGKAKSLRKRVSSYFVQSKEHSPKVRVLVRQIAEIRHIRGSSCGANISRACSRRDGSCATARTISAPTDRS